MSFILNNGGILVKELEIKVTLSKEEITKLLETAKTEGIKESNNTEMIKNYLQIEMGRLIIEKLEKGASCG